MFVVNLFFYLLYSDRLTSACKFIMLQSSSMMRVLVLEAHVKDTFLAMIYFKISIFDLQ